jgi:germination protein M
MRHRVRVLSTSILVLTLVLPAAAPPAGADVGAVTTTVYLLADQPPGGPFLMPVHRASDPSLDLPRAAIQALLAGPTDAERATVPAISTAIPADVELIALSIEDTVATIDLEGTFDDGGGSASMFARLGQLVYTLTRFDGVDDVALRLDGEPVEVFSPEGLVLDGPIGRDWFTGQDAGIIPPVLLETPAWEASFGPYVEGSIEAATESVELDIYDTDGRELGAATLVAEDDGSFASWLPFELPASGFGAVMVQPTNGPGLREHLVRFAADPVRGTTLACPEVPTPTFTDVPATATHADAIACAAHWRVMIGYPDDTFAPTVAVTRAQAASTIARLLGSSGIELPTDTELTYTDVPPTSPHAAAIAQLDALGVVRGLTAERFAPGLPVARGQLATMLHRSLSLFDGASLVASEPAFGDDDGSTHEPAIDLLAQLRLAAGTSRVGFSPGQPVNRGQMAALVSRTADLLVASGHATTPANLFDVHEVAVGDVIAGLRISSLEVSDPDAPSLTAHVSFTGEVTVSGTVTAHDDHEQLGDAVCMTSVDPTSERALPRMRQDTRDAWFCFTNSDVAAAEVFAPGTVTETTVVIDEFTIHHAPTEVWNTARLLRVEEGS